MSLTPPPPPPPPHRPSGLAPSGCKTPRLNTATRRLSTASSSSTSNLSPSGSSAPSPNQLRQILADITKQVTNSPQSRLATTTSSSSNAPRPSPIRSHHPAINGFMRPSLRETGPVTRSRSMLHLITPRSSLTPRATRANTPVRDENHSPLHPPTPRTPFTTINNNNNNSPSSSSRSHLRSPPSNENQASGSSSSSSSSSSSHHANRTPGHPIAPLRYRTLSSVSSSLTNPSSSPTGRSLTSQAPSRAQPPTPSHPSLRLRPHSSNPPSSTASTPPLTPASSLTSSTATSDSSNELASQLGLSTPRERRSLDQVDSPSASFDHKPSPSGSIAKRRRRNPSGLGRL